MFALLIDRWSSNEISTGDFVLVLALVSQITGSLLFIGRAVNATARTIGELREGLDELVIDHEIVDHTDAVALHPDGGLIEIHDVNFTYNTARVLEEFSLTIQAGQRVGLVGASGAGKSTLVSLLLRQHNIESGEILIDRQNIARVTQDSLRASIAVVPQEPALFHRTIRENIAYGKAGATDEEIIAVAKKAYAHDFIMELPQGYDTLVGERGVKLSGGQKQRIAIARAMLKNAPILLLDEATSALDSESEVAIQRALHQLMRGKTVIAIAHRLSTLREMDRIIVLEQGKIIEDGTHDTLREYGGTYARLWDHQAGGFLIESVL
jgi:ABC-type multidrug transport system fused ATPase/permease subunit